MNDLAREVLIKAALDGVPQIKRQLYDDKGGYCAIGVLTQALIPNIHMNERYKIFGSTHQEYDILRKVYDINFEEWSEIVRHNNVDGWDFLTIARKMGITERIDTDG